MLRMRAYYAKLAVIYLGVGIAVISRADTCETWFANSKLKPGSECLIKCVTHTVGMGTFQCHSQCEKLCAAKPASVSKNILGNLVDLYPALTETERKLAKSNPTRALKAYSLSWDAESECKKTFPTSDTNDESDACRHFMWAGLLAEEMGVTKARTYLDAHEQEPGQPQREKAMDLANNRAALLVAEKLLNEKKFSKETMMRSFLTNSKETNSSSFSLS